MYKLLVVFAALLTFCHGQSDRDVGRLPHNGISCDGNKTASYNNGVPIFDNDDKTFYQSPETRYSKFASVNVTLPSNRTLKEVTMAFYRWGDDWCAKNLEMCLHTWMRLAGVCVGTSQNNGTVQLCGCIGAYNHTKWMFDTPNVVQSLQPIYATVGCEKRTADQIHIVQTRPHEILQFSELYMYEYDITGAGDWNDRFIQDDSKNGTGYSYWGEWYKRNWDDNKPDANNGTDANNGNDCRDRPDCWAVNSTAIKSISIFLISAIIARFLD